jgi:hypothetical protein
MLGHFKPFSMDWTSKEVMYIIEDYFAMLQLDLNNQAYNKTTHRSALLPLLENRSPRSIEFKHQNISAVLAEMGLPFIKGYKPRFNYQGMLANEVSKYVKQHREILEKAFNNFSDEFVNTNEIHPPIFDNILDTNPVNSKIDESKIQYRPIKINYLEREQNNRQLGEEGERLVIEYEKWRLIKEGNENLANKIEWVSKNLGDGAGYDILSKNANGTDRYIEVKTTKLSKETPIYLTRTELRFASLKGNEFYLYRVFNFNSKPQFFIKQGRYEEFCNLQPVTFKGYF